MPNTGPQTFSSVSNISVGESFDWDIPGLGTIASLVGETASLSNLLVLSGADFSSIPLGSTIDGLKLTLTRESFAGIFHDEEIYVWKSGTPSGSGNAQGIWPTTPAAQDYGGAASVLGATGITRTVVVAAGFGFAVQVEGGGGEDLIYLQAATGTVYYTEPVAAPVIAVTGVADNGTSALGSVALNTNITRQFTINNTGDAGDTLGTLLIAGTGWSIDAGDNPSTDPLAASGSTTVTVIGNFSAAGAKTGTLTIPSNDAASPYVINLTATALAPANGNRNLLLMGCG
jgi:hypothetical protein